MSLPPVEVNLVPMGTNNVLRALLSIEQATVAHASRMKAVTARQMADIDTKRKFSEDAAKREADAAIREATRASTAIARASSSTQKVTANRDNDGASAALSKSTDKAAAGLLSFDSAISGLARGVSLAASAVEAFGGYLMKDIIGPQLELGTKATQLANQMGGVSGARVQASINGLFAENPQADLKTITDVMAKAGDYGGDMERTEQIARIALESSKAYGYDAVKMAGVVGTKSANMEGMSNEQFGNAMRAQIGSTQGVADPDEFMKAGVKISQMAARFATLNKDGTVNQDSVESNDQIVQALVSAGTGKGMGAAKSAAALEHLLEDLRRDPKFKATNADGTMKHLPDILVSLMKATGGNLGNLGGGKKQGALGDVQIGALNDKSSLNFLRSLGIDKAYQSAEAMQPGSGAAAVDARLKQILDPAEGLAKFAAAQKAIEADTGMQLDQAMRTLKVTLTTALLPVLQEQGPKIAAALGKLVEGLQGVDLVGLFTALAKSLAVVLYAVLDMVPSTLLGKSGKSMKDALGVMINAGEDKYEGGEADRKLNPEKYKAGSVAGDAARFLTSGPVGFAESLGIAPKGFSDRWGNGTDYAANDLGGAGVGGTAQQAMDAIQTKHADATMAQTLNAKSIADNTHAMLGLTAVLNGIGPIDPSRTTPIVGQVGVK